MDVTRKTGAMRSLERLVEIREGLCTGEPVVRDLAELMEEESLIRGTVLGFWKPGERPR